jgi:exonuclease VII large subunit
LFDILADDLNRLLTEERQRCDALANDNDSMFRLLEETRTQMLEIENNFKEKFQEDIKIIDQLNSQINYLREETEMKDKQIDIQVDNQFEIFED